MVDTFVLKHVDPDPRKSLKQKIEEAFCHFERLFYIEPEIAEVPVGSGPVRVDGLRIVEVSDLPPGSVRVRCAVTS